MMDSAVLKQIPDWPWQNWGNLLDVIKNCWNYTYGKIEYTESKVTFITGGWIENEEIISALEQNTMIVAMYWEKSQRGGLHVYWLPET